HDDGEGTDRVPPPLGGVRFGNLLVERATLQRVPERVLPETSLFCKALRAGILFTFVAEDAVIDLAQGGAPVEPLVRQIESLAAPVVRRIADDVPDLTPHIGDPAHYRRREGFDLTDERFDRRSAL